MEKKAYVYVLRCADNTLYTGYTTDLKRRLAEHQAGSRKCKYTMARSRRPVEIASAWCIELPRGNALKVEAFIKALPKSKKEILIENPSQLSKWYTDKKEHMVQCQPVEGTDINKISATIS